MSLYDDARRCPMSLYDDAVEAVFKIREATQAELDAAAAAARANHLMALQTRLRGIFEADHPLYPIVDLLASHIMVETGASCQPFYQAATEVHAVVRAAIIAYYGCDAAGCWPANASRGVDEFGQCVAAVPLYENGGQFRFEPKRLVPGEYAADMASHAVAAEYRQRQVGQMERPEAEAKPPARELDLSEPPRAPRKKKVKP